jgi:signal transduction histidine kinase
VNRRLGLRARLVLAAAYLLVAVLVALEIPFALSVERRAVEELKSVEIGYASLIASQVSGAVADLNGRAAIPGPTNQVLATAVAGVIDRVPDARILIVDSKRRSLLDVPEGTPNGTPFETAERPELVAALSGSITSVQRHSDTVGDDLLLVAVPIFFNGQNLVGAVRISQSMGEVRADVRRAWAGLVVVGLIALAVGLVLAWLLAAGVAAPVARLEQTAARFGSGRLEARAELRGPAEVAALAQSFNAMADAVTANLQAQRDFLANASHQLRTPLTGLRLRLEAIEGEGGAAAGQAGKAQGEVDRLSRLVGDLLTLAKAASAESTGASVELATVAAQAAERWAGAAAEAGHELRAGPAPRNRVAVWADPGDLAQLADNLIENAIRYTPEGTTVTVSAEAGGDGAVLVVADDGPGIPEAERGKVFDRFYRGSGGRRAGSGTGLGLAIVVQLAGRWGGTARLAPAGRGTRVEVAFPAVQGPATSPPTIS